MATSRNPNSRDYVTIDEIDQALTVIVTEKRYNAVDNLLDVRSVLMEERDQCQSSTVTHNQ